MTTRPALGVSAQEDAVGLVEELLHNEFLNGPMNADGEGKRNCIALLYRAQHELYRRGLRRMETTLEKDVRSIRLSTIDAFQQAPIIIVDLVVTDRLSFTHELN